MWKRTPIALPTLINPWSQRGIGVLFFASTMWGKRVKGLRNIYTPGHYRICLAQKVQSCASGFGFLIAAPWLYVLQRYACCRPWRLNEPQLASQFPTSLHPWQKQASRKHEEHMTQQTQPLANFTLKSLHVGVVTSEPPPPKELIAQVLNAHLPWQIYSPKPYRFPPWDANRNVCLPPPLRSHTRAAPKNNNVLLLGLPNSTCICLHLYKIIPCAARKYVTQMAVPQAELNNWGRAS